MKEKIKGEPCVFIPEGARINVYNKEEVNPIVEYEIRKQIVDREKVKKLCGGIYGITSN